MEFISITSDCINKIFQKTNLNDSKILTNFCTMNNMQIFISHTFEKLNSV